MSYLVRVRRAAELEIAQTQLWYKAQGEGLGAGFHAEVSKVLDRLTDTFVEIPAKSTDEPRVMAVGRIAGRHWSAVVTPRQGKVRIISVRRSRSEEIEIYEGSMS